MICLDDQNCEEILLFSSRFWQPCHQGYGVLWLLSSSLNTTSINSFQLMLSVPVVLPLFLPRSLLTRHPITFSVILASFSPPFSGFLISANDCVKLDPGRTSLGYPCSVSWQHF